MIFYLVEIIRGFLMPYPFWLRNIGRRGEYLARRRLHRRGYHLVAKNWRFGHGEIDLIMSNRRSVLFVEVKTRREEPGLKATEVVGDEQRERLNYLSHVFIKQWPDLDLPYRFVVMLVTYSPNRSRNRYEVVPLG